MKGADWDGRSYAATLKDGADTGRDELILSQCAHVCQRSVRWDNWLYMKTYHDGIHPHWDEEMLFDVVADPHEQNNLAAEKPEIVAEGRKRLAAWKADCMARQPFVDKRDPMDTVLEEGGPMHSNVNMGVFPGYFKRLEETGRGGWLEKIKERHPAYFEKK